MPDGIGTIWVTGAGGALGGALVSHFGGAARGVTRGDGSLPEIGWLPEDQSGAVIVHAAGHSASNAGERAEDLAAPHLAFAHALVARGWRGKLVYLSSAAVYGDTGVESASETASAAPLSPYGQYKLIVERGLAELSEATGFALTILRLSNVYGTALDLSRRRVAALILDALARESPFTVHGDGASSRDYLHIGDFCHGVERAAAEGEGTFNLAHGTGTTLNALIATCEVITGRCLIRRDAPHRTEPVCSTLDISRARLKLSWQPRMPLDRGVAALHRAMGG